MLAGYATPALAQPGRLAGGGSLNISLMRIVLALLFCLGIAFLAAVLLRRGGGRFDLSVLGSFAKTRPQRRIEVLETRRISQHADVCLLSCDGMDYLILSSSSAQKVLRSVPRLNDRGGVGPL